VPAFIIPVQVDRLPEAAPVHVITAPVPAPVPPAPSVVELVMMLTAVADVIARSWRCVVARRRRSALRAAEEAARAAASKAAAEAAAEATQTVVLQLPPLPPALPQQQQQQAFILASLVHELAAMRVQQCAMLDAQMARDLQLAQTQRERDALAAREHERAEWAATMRHPVYRLEWPRPAEARR